MSVCATSFLLLNSRATEMEKTYTQTTLAYAVPYKETGGRILVPRSSSSPADTTCHGDQGMNCITEDQHKKSQLPVLVLLDRSLFSSSFSLPCLCSLPTFPLNSPFLCHSVPGSWLVEEWCLNHKTYTSCSLNKETTVIG